MGSIPEMEIKMQSLGAGELEDILLEAGLVSPQKLDKMKKIQRETGERIEKILLCEEMINYGEILRFLAGKMGVDFVDLESIPVNKEALQKLDRETARRYTAFPFDMEDDCLSVAMEKPDDTDGIHEMQLLTQMEVRPFLADRRLIGRAINYFYAVENAGEYATAERAALDDRHGDRPEETGKQQEQTHIADRDTMDIETALARMFTGALTMDYVTDIHIDRLNRRITATVTIQYD